MLKTLERRKAKGLPVPALDNRPDVLSDVRDIWEAWNILHGARKYIMGAAQPIEIGEINALCMILGMDDPDDRAQWLRLIRSTDLAWYTAKATLGEKTKGVDERLANPTNRNRRKEGQGRRKRV